MGRYIPPVFQELDDSANPLVEGKLYFYRSGTNDFEDTYADINLSIKNSNPVILSGAGRTPNIFLGNTTYNVILTDGDDKQVWQVDPVGDLEAQGSFSIWNSITVYNNPDIVTVDGKFYLSIGSDNQGNDPETSPNYWTEIKFTNVWNPNQTYITNDIVQGSNGLIYVSTSDGNLNNDPVTDSANWKPPSTLDIPPIISAAAIMYAYDNF